MARQVTGSAGKRVVARELLIPKEDFSEHALCLGNWVLTRNRYGRDLSQGCAGDNA